MTHLFLSKFVSAGFICPEDFSIKSEQKLSRTIKDFIYLFLACVCVRVNMQDVSAVPLEVRRGQNRLEL